MTFGKESSVRIAILGAGAMGSIFGAELASHGVETLLVDVSEPLVEQIDRDGVLIRSEDGERRVPIAVTANPADESPADLLIVFVKSWATDDALALAGPLLGEDTIVLSLQNGIGNGEQVARRAQARRVLVGVTYHSATVAGLGVVDHTALGTTYLGPLEGADLDAAERVAATLSGAGLSAEATAEVGKRIWRKLMLNLAANPVAALTGLRSAQLIEEPHVDALMGAITREAVAVARAEGHELDPDDTIAYVRESLRLAGSATASMRQDVLAGRPTEVDGITGALVALAERRGVAVPLNSAVLALVKGYEASLPTPEAVR